MDSTIWIKNEKKQQILLIKIMINAFNCNATVALNQKEIGKNSGRITKKSLKDKYKWKDINDP